MAKKTKKKVQAEQEHRVYLELNGSVNIVEVKDGVKTTTPLEGEVVLRALLCLIDQATREALSNKSEMNKLVKYAKVKTKKPKGKK